MGISSELTDSQRPDVAPDAYVPSRLECLGGVIVSPVRTFEHLASKPQWLFPLIVLVLWVLVSSVIRTSVISATAFANATSEMGAGGQLAAFGAFATGALVSCVVLALETVGAVLLLLAATGVLYAIARAFKLRPRFYPLVSTLAYAEFVPRLIRTSIKEFFPLLTGNFSLSSPELPTGVLQVFSAMGFPLLLRPLLAYIEMFHIWSFALVAVSVRFVARASAKRAVLITALYWVACITAAIGATALWELVSNALSGL